jgi:Zn-dependent protease
MAREPDKISTPEAPVYLSPGRLWAEQLAMGMGILLAILIFMAFKHPAKLAEGTQVLTTGDLMAYGWKAVAGMALLVIIHEAASLAAARYYGLPLRIRVFGFGVNAAATLSPLPRRTWIDAMVGLAGPLTGTLVSLALAGIYHLTDNPYFLGMACVGYFYNLFTLIPILDLEGGWVAPAVATVAWFFGLVAVMLVLAHFFNLVLLGVFSFGVPRLLLLLRAKAPQLDLDCTGRQRLIMSLAYFVLVIELAWFGTSTFDALARIVPEAMGD